MWRRYLRFWGTDVEADVSDELEFHLESRIEDLIDQGWSPDEARAEAQRRFGELADVRRECVGLGRRRERRAQRRLSLDALSQNIRYAVRRLLQKPGFTATAVLSLAIGIGANTAIFSIVNAILLRDVPLKEPSRLVNIYLATPAYPHAPFSYPDYDDVVAGSSEIFEGVLASNIIIGQTERDGAVETIIGEVVSGNYFQLLGVEPHVGRLLLPEDDIAPGAHPLVVLGHSYWKSRFGADPQVVGKNLPLAGRPFEIIGVAPDSYRGDMRGVVPSFYTPRMMVNIIKGAGSDALLNRGSHSNQVKARLRPGVFLTEAQAVVEGIADHIREQDLEGWNPESTFALLPTSDVLLFPSLDSWVRATAWLLTVFVGLALMMACANLAGFILAQAVDRKKEISLRLALGATRRNLIGQLLTESLLLAAVGGAAGIAVAVGLLKALLGADLKFFYTAIELDVGLDLTAGLYGRGHSPGRTRPRLGSGASVDEAPCRLDS